MSPIIRELNRRAASGNGTQYNHGKLESVICVTGQHRQMLDQVLGLVGVVPDYDLDVMKDNQSPTQVASAVLAGLEPVLRKERPDWVLVQGDTTTVVAASLAAFYAGVKVGHVEAGLRTDDKWQPFPEEINRRVAGVMADLHFAPTEHARRNLLREGVRGDTVLVTGNTVIDALQWVAGLPMTSQVEELLAQLGLQGGDHVASSGSDTNARPKLILVTAHRRENFGKPLGNICLALRELAARYREQIRIVYPVHLNPNVWEPVHHLLGDVSEITLLPPLDYLPLVQLMKRSHLVLTDSGGIQEEAPGLGKPVLVLRDVTERTEAVDAGTVRLVGTDREAIVSETVRLIEDSEAYATMSRAINPYGDGRAAGRIVSALLGQESEKLGDRRDVHLAMAVGRV